ncbi:hypothetical protein F66182_9172 [Fusarium sp. NRRL 66182]|nr:hypothetical protein F66182_9172 [Fusarium sp. NRRL 66182]
MEHDIVARLYPHGFGIVGKRASNAIKANSRYVPPLLAQPSLTRYSRHERESTEPPDNPGASALDYLPYLVVRFSDVPRTDKGLVFGSNASCDVLLDYRGVSGVHFSLTFDNYHRLVVKDFNSRMGTQVTYDGKGKGARTGFHWIVGGHRIPQGMEHIIITVAGVVSFQIIIPFHDITSPVYINKTKSFNQGTATAEGLFGALGLSNSLTRRGTGANTPGTEEIQLKKKLGEGSYGVVTYLWNVSTGDERVIKAPISKGKVDEEGWRQEARIMSQVSHPHIVQLIKASFIPHPRLELEYMSCGCLNDHENISYNETLMIISQCSSALTYLHGFETPIVHRDIKTANILVHYRFNDDIYVKLGDFGLSQHKTELMTICGTGLYLAPEIYSDHHRSLNGEAKLGYTPAVDVWSLGVVAYQLIYSLPTYKNKYKDNGIAWCKKVITGLEEAYQKKPNALAQVLLNAMLVLSPERRFPAGDCYDLVMELCTTEPGSFHSSPPASYIKEGDQTTLRYTLQNYEAEDLSTVRFQPRSTGASTSYHFVRSGAPAPQPSSSAIGYYINQREGHELTHFLEDYASNSFHPVYVGSSLASQLGGNDSQQWGSQFSQPMHPSQTGAGGSQTCDGSGLVEGSNAISPGDYEELAQAAYLLQSLGQDVRAP